MACLFHLLSFYFAEQIYFFFILVKSNRFSFFSFVDDTASIVVNSYHETQNHIGFLTLSSTNFIILHLIFKYMIHLKLMFVKSVRSVFSFIFF